MSDAQIPVLNVTVIDYVPGSTDDNAPIKYVKLGQNGQFQFDKPLLDTKKGFKEKYRYADIAIALFEKNRLVQVNKSGGAMPPAGLKADPEPVIPINQISNLQSPKIIYQIIPTAMPVRKAYSPILPRPTNDPRTANGQTILLSPRSDSISAGFSGALIAGKPSPKPIAPKILHSTESPQVFQNVAQNVADEKMSQSSEMSTTVEDLKTEAKEDGFPSSSRPEFEKTETGANEPEEQVKTEQVSIPAEAVKSDPLRLLDVLLDACDSYVRDDITLGEEQAAQERPEDEIQIPQETSVEAPVAEVAPNAAEKAPETVQKKKRGRPKGSTKKKMEERKKESEAKGVKASAKKKPEPKKKARGRPPKAKPAAKTGKNKPKPFPMPLLESSSSSSSGSEETESSEPESTDSSEDDATQRASKIKMPGESLDKIKKASSAAAPKRETEQLQSVNSQLESPQKEQARKSSLTSAKEPASLNKMARKTSLSKNSLSNRPEKTAPALPVINDRIKFMKMFEQLQHEKLEPTGYIPGRLVQELEDAVTNGTINDFGRKLVGMKSLNPDGKFTISEEVNGKLGDSALCKAASVRVDKGGPSLITSLVHIAGADTHQTNPSGNTALHIAAEAGIPGNVATLLSYKSPINVRNNKKETALLLAVRRATKFEKLYHKNMNSSVLAVEFKSQWSDAFRCVEMLLSAGGNIDKITLQAAETSSAADLLYLYHYTVIENVYKFVKSTLGKANLTVHDRLLYSATIVPRDQNVFEFTIDPVEFLRPGMFLTLFAVHGRHDGFSCDFEKLQDLRLSGNPCLLSEAKWHAHSADHFTKKPSILALEGFPSWSLMGPFEPGKDLEKYEERVENQHFITFLNYTPFRENRYTLSIVPAHWTDELLFLCVYPSEIQISNATFQKGAPEILRQKERAFRNWENAREKARLAKFQWEREFPGEECEILRRGVNVNLLKH